MLCFMRYYMAFILIKMIQKKEVNKEIVFFYYTEITHQIIDEVLEFIQNVPKSVNGQFTGGLSFQV